MKTPYTPLFATDFLVHKDKLSEGELKTILSYSSEIALWDSSDIDLSSLSLNALKYLESILNALKKTKQKSEAGKKGGRPAAEKE